MTQASLSLLDAVEQTRNVPSVYDRHGLHFLFGKMLISGVQGCRDTQRAAVHKNLAALSTLMN